jgi:hypothetical protein
MPQKLYRISRQEYANYSNPTTLAEGLANFFDKIVGGGSAGAVLANLKSTSARGLQIGLLLS